MFIVSILPRVFLSCAIRMSDVRRTNKNKVFAIMRGVMQACRAFLSCSLVYKMCVPLFPACLYFRVFSFPPAQIGSSAGMRNVLVPIVDNILQGEVETSTLTRPRFKPQYDVEIANLASYS